MEVGAICKRGSTNPGRATDEERVKIYRGFTKKQDRESLRDAFNAPPEEHPLRILIATDAAREGLNLQAYCHHLFHFDVPWNPSRMEQRNHNTFFNVLHIPLHHSPPKLNRSPTPTVTIHNISSLHHFTTLTSPSGKPKTLAMQRSRRTVRRRIFVNCSDRSYQIIYPAISGVKRFYGHF